MGTSRHDEGIGVTEAVGVLCTEYCGVNLDTCPRSYLRQVITELWIDFNDLTVRLDHCMDDLNWPEGRL